MSELRSSHSRVPSPGIWIARPNGTLVRIASGPSRKRDNGDRIRKSDSGSTGSRSGEGQKKQRRRSPLMENMRVVIALDAPRWAWALVTLTALATNVVYWIAVT